MIDKTEKSHREILAIKEKLNEIHSDMKRFIERSNHLHIETILSGSQNSLINAIIGHVYSDIEDDLENNMVRKCEMRDECKSNFTGFLHDNADLLRSSEIDEDIIKKNQSALIDMRNSAPLKQCEKCFSEVQNLFGDQINLMRSLQIYNVADEKKLEISSIGEDFIVSVLEPLSNRQRMQMLKAIALETKTFSSLSELTGLRGGNLLFHLQKLLDSGMILQRHERGDYMITEKGFKILKSIGDLHSMLTQ